MRLWHQELIDKLPRQQLISQHRECCALRGLGWQKKHKTIDYIFNYNPVRLVAYHWLVMEEMHNRGYNPNERWLEFDYRGKKVGIDEGFCNVEDIEKYIIEDNVIYSEHNQEYLDECIDNLADKGCVCRYFEDEFEQYLKNI